MTQKDKLLYLVKNLRDSKFTQVSGVLRKFSKDDQNLFCAEGIICESFRELTQEGNWKFNVTDNNSYRFMLKDVAYAATAPDEVMDFFFCGDIKAGTFMDLNEAGVSLKYIAEKIVIDYSLQDATYTLR